MRLTDHEIDSIKTAVHHFDPEAQIFIFGSRAHDNAAGGDIDLLIESKTIQFDNRISILAAIKKMIGEQKIDLLVSKGIDSDIDPFIQSIRKEMKQL